MTEFAPGLHAAIGKEVDASAYDRFTGRWSRLFVPDAVAAAEIHSGCTVLDICTGTGEVAVAVMPLIGGSGIVVGADISPEMVRSARQRVNHPQFWPVVTDGQALALQDDCFDSVVCQLGLQFFPNPAQGLSEFHRVLRPGGKVSVCVISTPDQAPLWGELAETLGRYLPEKRHILTSSFSLSDPGRFEGLLKGAGLRTSECFVTCVAPTWETSGNIGIRSRLASAPSRNPICCSQRRTDAQCGRRFRRMLVRFETDGTLHPSVEMLIGSGRKDA